MPTAEQIKDEDLLYIGEKDTSSGGYRSRKASIEDFKQSLRDSLFFLGNSMGIVPLFDFEHAYAVKFPANNSATIYTLPQDSLVVPSSSSGAATQISLYLPDFVEGCQTPIDTFGPSYGNGIILKTGTRIRVTAKGTTTYTDVYHEHIGWSTTVNTPTYDAYANIAPLIGSSSNTSTEP